MIPHVDCTPLILMMSQPRLMSSLSLCARVCLSKTLGVENKNERVDEWVNGDRKCKEGLTTWKINLHEVLGVRGNIFLN